MYLFVSLKKNISDINGLLSVYHQIGGWVYSAAVGASKQSDN